MDQYEYLRTSHRVITTKGGKYNGKVFEWLNTVMGNVKSAIFTSNYKFEKKRNKDQEIKVPGPLMVSHVPFIVYAW